MLTLLLTAAAEIAALQFAGDCATLAHEVRAADGEPTAIEFQGLEMGLSAADESGSLACQVSVQIVPPPGFRVGISGVHVRGAVSKGAEDELDLTLRGGEAGRPSASMARTVLSADGDFDAGLGGATLWSGCGESAPTYQISLDGSGFHPAGAASAVRLRIVGIGFDAIAYRRCPATD